jgi:dihydroxyacetone kinase
MTRVLGDPRAFRSDMMVGFAHAYRRYVSRVPGAAGFVRAGGPTAGKVSVLVGGGCGHYPSYSGIVGSGFADACVLGDVFTSPSSDQITAVGRAADGGAGLVLAFGNYAGDRLNFAMAAERLASEGIDSRTVYVTDDVASAAAAESDRRRGIAGTFTVYKVGGAAADRGDDLDAVERLMRRANDRTRSFGVAFAGCVLPGQTAPLFTVDVGTMETGLGIHGEPGVGSSPLLPAPELAALLVEGVLAERPDDAAPRAAVLLNGLGATKYEELFLLYGWVHDLLARAGVEPVLPEVGELVTSLDMAGCSLSITWLDDELEECWSAPAETAAFRRGPSTGRDEPAEGVKAALGSVTSNAAPPSSAESRAIALVIRRMIAAMLDAAVEHEIELGRLDAVAGDGDHGTGMVRGLSAAAGAAEATRGGAWTVLDAAGSAFADRAGGTSGALWGVLLRAVAEVLGDDAPVGGTEISRALRAGADAVQRIGGAKVGDKTMVDALLPFCDTFQARIEDGLEPADAWSSAADIAVAAARRTETLVPRLGRARPLAARSVGSPDPGAVSMGLLLTAAGAVLEEHPCRDRHPRSE